MLKGLIPAIPSFALVIVGASLVASCGITDTGDAARELASEGASKAADRTLENIEQLYCRVPSIGAIRRNYMGTRKWSAFLIICDIAESEVVPYVRVELPK